VKPRHCKDCRRPVTGNRLRCELHSSARRATKLSEYSRARYLALHPIKMELRREVEHRLREGDRRRSIWRDMHVNYGVIKRIDREMGEWR
jgi:hypothetical protein